MSLYYPAALKTPYPRKYKKMITERSEPAPKSIKNYVIIPIQVHVRKKSFYNKIKKLK